jgi:hypothetical protein
VQRPPGSVVVTVRTADPAAVLAVRPGDRVDVLAGPATDGSGTVIAGTPDGASGGSPAGDATVASGLVVLEVPGAVVARDATDQAAGGDVTSGLLGGADPSAGAAPTDTAGVLVVAADRAAASRLASATGRSLTVVVVSP